MGEVGQRSGDCIRDSCSAVAHRPQSAGNITAVHIPKKQMYTPHTPTQTTETVRQCSHIQSLSDTREKQNRHNVLINQTDSSTDRYYRQTETDKQMDKQICKTDKSIYRPDPPQ